MCVSYAPFRGAQDPLVEGTRVTPKQIDEDLALLAKYTNCIRTYSVDDGRDDVLKSARRYGLKVMHGVWVSGDPEKTRRQVATSIAYAKEFPDVIIAIVVGNEVLLRGEMTAANLIAVIRDIKAQVAMPVTYADVWEFWLRYPDVQSAVDFVTIHVLPYWEDFPIPASRAAAHLVAIRNKVAAVFPGKEIVIGEFGWPSAGRMREDALPSPYDQARAVIDTLTRGEGGENPCQHHRGFRSALEARARGCCRRLLGHHRPRDGRAEIQFFGRLHLQSSGLAAAGARRHRAGGAHIWRRHLGPRRQGIARASMGKDRRARLRSRRICSAGPSKPCWWKASAPAAGRARSRLRWSPASPRLSAPRALPPAGASRLSACSLAAAARAVIFSIGRLGGVLIALMLVAIEAALGLVFDPRYRDIPFAPLTAAALPFLILLAATRRLDGTRAAAESVAGAVLGLSAGYIVFNETFASWQSVWFCAGLLGLAAILLSARDAPSSE